MCVCVCMCSRACVCVHKLEHGVSVFFACICVVIWAKQIKSRENGQ